MLKASELLRQGRTEDLWQMCCGFLDLTIDEFMAIQERLLMRQIDLLADCPLGKRLMKGRKPESMDEFRKMVPITTYRDYTPELSEKREDVLPAMPEMWIHSSGKTGEYAFKWIPVSKEFLHESSLLSYGAGLLSSAQFKGDTRKAPLRPKIVYAVAPRPYYSGALAEMLCFQTDVEYLPSIKTSETLEFDERIKLGFAKSLDSGFDYFFGLSLVLTTVGDRFKQSSNSVSLSSLMKKPKSLVRLLKALMISKAAGRSLLPRDIWKVKGIICGGLDSIVYRDKIKQLWGRYPLDIYAGTEGGIYAIQAWDYTTMTFVPNLNFFEFVTEDENLKWQMDKSYQPKTLLLNELKPGESYEVVITNFHGGAMVRYRPGDMIRVVSMQNETLNIQLPQIVFDRRADDVLDFVFVRLTEKLIWEAIESVGIGYEDWIAYKSTGEASLNILLELREKTELTENDIAKKIFEVITSADEESKTLIPNEYSEMINFRVNVTLLPRGTFTGYMKRRQAEGYDLAHLKPVHINPPQSTLQYFVEEEELIEVFKPLKEAKRDQINISETEQSETINV